MFETEQYNQIFQINLTTVSQAHVPVILSVKYIERYFLDMVNMLKLAEIDPPINYGAWIDTYSGI